MRPAHKALVALAGGVVAYNIAAKDGETISEGLDELIVKYPMVARAVIALVALHCANAINQRVDPLHLAFVAARRRRVVMVVEPA